MKKLYGVTLTRSVDGVTSKWDEMLHDQLFDQKKKLAYLALGIDSQELRTWVLEWKFDNPEIENYAKALEQINVEFPDGQVPKLFAEFWMYGILALKCAFDAFMSGEFVRALSLAFSIEYHIGLWHGMERERSDRGKSQRNKDDLEDKKLVLNFYSKNRLEELSNDAAAAKLVDVKPKLTGMKARTLSLLIGKYKKFLAKCDEADAGKILLEKHRQALSIIDNQNIGSEVELQNARSFILAKEENDKQRIEAFVELGEEAYSYVSYFDRVCLADFHSLP